MIPKPLFGKVKVYVLKLRKEYESETVGKTGLAAVPVEIGRLICSLLQAFTCQGNPASPRKRPGTFVPKKGRKRR